MILAVDELSLSISLSFVKSSSLLTKDRAIKSTLCFIPNCISFMSFEVIEGRLTLTPGRFTCLLLPILPPSITLHNNVSSSLDRTLKFISPLSTVIFEPGFTLLIKSL